HVYDTGTHQPIPGATVTVINASIPPTFIRGTATDATGHYQFDNLPADSYRVLALAQNYMFQSYNGKGSLAQADTLILSSGQAVTIDFNLTYGAGAISGTVYQANGSTPIPNATLIAIDAATGLLIRGIISGADGTYTISSLPPGSYKIQTTSGVLSEWYHDKGSFAEADAVTVASLANTPGINFTLGQEVQQYTLTLAANPAGSGTTTPAVGAHDYPQGTVVPITATPAPGYRFVNWTGEVADANAASTTVTMDASKTITANFAITLISNPVAIAEALASIAGKYPSAWGFNSVSHTWLLNAPSAPPYVNSLGEFARGQGYWIHATENCALTYSTLSYPLYTGWNLIGWGASADNATPLPQALDGVVDKVQIIWAFDAPTQSWKVYDLAPGGATTLQSLVVGHGYWMRVTEDCQLQSGANTYDLKTGWNLVGWLG
ncbi:MAG: carboxypeptidase regulatory-like domain-containing protein, partial [Dehalococcoidia bacterium]